MKRSVATRFGWAGNPDVTWKDIAAKARAGQLRYGMTNPAASNSGFSALVGVAAALAGTGDALRAEDLDERGLTDFFTGQTLTAGSSGWLADAYVVERTTLDYLPTALERYLNLPRGYANRVPVSGGRTARQILLAQLALLETQLDEVLDAVAKGDADRLLAHGRFLEDRFGRSQLDLG